MSRWFLISSLGFATTMTLGALGACADDGDEECLGAVGCACTAGGGCDPDLVCHPELGKCVEAGGVSASGGDASGSGGDASGDGGGDDGPYYDVGGGNTGGGDEGACPCAPKSDLIYLLAHNDLGPGDLWTFNPETSQFTNVAPLNCSSENVFSMGVARNGKAWVQTYPSGDLFNIDINTGECSDPGFSPNAQFGNFGMAFVSNGPGDTCDKIHAVAGEWTTQPYECPGQGCGILGKMSGTALETISAIDFHGGEMTGTGNGRLFSFIGVNPAKVVEFDKSDGSVLDTIPLQGLELTDAFAFAFWGGDIYFFTEANNTLPNFPEAPSKVHKLDFDESEGNGKALTTYVDQAPILVAGAGVSTCAPFVPPG